MLFSVWFTGIIKLIQWVNIVLNYFCSSQTQNGSNPIKVSSIKLHKIYLYSWVVCSHDVMVRAAYECVLPYSWVGGCCRREAARKGVGGQGVEWKDSDSIVLWALYVFLIPCVSEATFLLEIWNQNEIPAYWLGFSCPINIYVLFFDTVNISLKCSTGF